MEFYGNLYEKFQFCLSQMMPGFYDTATIHQISFTSETNECETLNKQCIPMRLPEFPPNHQPYQMENVAADRMMSDGELHKLFFCWFFIC